MTNNIADRSNVPNENHVTKFAPLFFPKKYDNGASNKGRKIEAINNPDSEAISYFSLE
jgi:hypothetical protein